MKIHFYKALQLAAWERDNYTCFYCGYEMRELYELWEAGHIRRKAALITLDHIIPKLPNERERRNSLNNVVTACFSCNQAKGGWKNLPEAQKAKLLTLTQ